MINCCIYCSSSNFVLNGHDKEGVQRYKCNECKKRFCEKGIFARMRFPKEVITNALFLRLYPLSTRNVKRILKKLNYNDILPRPKGLLISFATFCFAKSGVS